MVNDVHESIVVYIILLILNQLSITYKSENGKK